MTWLDRLFGVSAFVRVVVAPCRQPHTCPFPHRIVVRGRALVVVHG